MTNVRRIAVITLLVPLALALMVGIVFGVDRVTNGGEVLGRVAVAGIDLGGLGEDDVRTELAELENRMAETPIEVSVAGEIFSLDPAAVGFSIEQDTIVDAAFLIGRDGDLTEQFGWWVDRFGDDRGEQLEIPYGYDEAALADIIEKWELEGIADPPSVGNVQIVDYFVEAEYPVEGTGIDRAAAAEVIGAALGDPARSSVEIPSRRLEPALTDSDIAAVVAEANALLEGPVILANSAYATNVEIPRHVLAESLRITRDDTTDPPSFDLTWQNEPLTDFMEGRIAGMSTEPVDAEIRITEDDAVEIVPSIPALSPDLASLADVVAVAATTPSRSTNLPYAQGFEAEFSTADAEALGIKEKVSEFTTYHNCCENRVINIHTIADAVDGAIVMPGETWSLNAHVGQRTVEKGYVAAGAIIGGYVQCCDSPINIGGGTSQFTTTLYNAIFYGGYEDVEHQPHTIYFSRYPEGIEATLGFPSPDLKFRNNTDAAVLIDTSHTETSITVKFFGDNGGIEVRDERSGRYNYTGARTVYEVNRSLDPCVYGSKKKGRVISSGSGGWSIDIDRIFVYPDGTEELEGEWTWHYSGAYRVIEYNPAACKDPGGGGGGGGEAR
jgi:vancomycin resistance protein YoaR